MNKILYLATSAALLLQCTSLSVEAASQADSQTQVSTNRPCYEHGQDIVVTFIDEHPKEKDWLGFYSASDRTDNFGEPLIWMRSCQKNDQGECKDEQHQQSAQWGKYTFFFEEDQYVLPPGTYKIILSQDHDEQPYGSIAETHNFIVEQPGQKCDGSTVPTEFLRPGLRGGVSSARVKAIQNPDHRK